jgi:3-oxoacyl-(acyl-carrier-protein) synthase
MTTLAVLAQARWPQDHDDRKPPALAGFVVSSFSPLCAETAERCLRLRYGEPPAFRKTAVALVSVAGDHVTASAVAAAVDAGRPVAPLLFFQSVPNAVAGYVAARWGLTGPVVCISPVGDPQADGVAEAALLIDDGDADEVLLVLAEQGEADMAVATLLGAPTETEGEGQ